MTNYLDRQTFEDCMRQVFSRLDRHQEMLASMQEGKKEQPPPTGIMEDDTMDNQDVCMLLHVSKRTLQRYRSDGLLPYVHQHPHEGDTPRRGTGQGWRCQGKTNR